MTKVRKWHPTWSLCFLEVDSLKAMTRKQKFPFWAVGKTGR